MARFSISGTGLNTSGVALLGVTSTAAVRPKIYDIIIGSRAAPLDDTCTYEVARATTAPTATAVTPSPLDLLSSSAIAGAWQNATTLPTKGVILLTVSLNKRATFRWVAAPGSELISAATVAYGIYIYTNTPTTAFITETCMLYEE